MVIAWCFHYTTGHAQTFEYYVKLFKVQFRICIGGAVM